MRTRLYALSTSHPAWAAHLMLEHKRLDHTVVNLVPGFHPLQLRTAGFSGPTVPALELDGRRVQRTLDISRELDRLVAEPRLFPPEGTERQQVEEAERWGEAELQPIPRRVFRWASLHDRRVRRWLGEISGFPAPGVGAALGGPMARVYARVSSASDEQVSADLATLPDMLTRVDRLIEDGVLDGEASKAADLQVAATVRWLLAFEQLRPVLAGRAAADHALRHVPNVPFPEPFPVELPEGGLGPLWR
jgi:glutathione S-transferase